MKSLWPLANRFSAAMAIVAVLAFYIATPGHPESLARGFPLHPLVTSVLLPLTFILWSKWRAPRNPLVGLAVLGILALAMAKVAISLGAPEPGALGAYVSHGNRGSTAVERSLDFRGLSEATRIDQRLSFDQQSFPVFFVNDNERFNFYQPGEPDRTRLPVTVTWLGAVTVPESRDVRLWLTSTGSARLQFDGAQILEVNGEGRERVDARPMMLSGGPHSVSLEYVREQSQVASVSAEWDMDGDRAPIGAPYLTTRPTSSAELRSIAQRAAIARVGDGIAASLVTLIVLGRTYLLLKKREFGEMARLFLGFWAAGITLYGVMTSLDLIGRVVILEGGQDWLTYEYYSRDIALNGPLMTLGKALGQGRAFVFQPLYPYYLAALHLVFGEGIYGPQVAHFAGFGLAGIALWFMGRELFGNVCAWVTLALFTLLVFTQLDVVSRRLLSENLYFFVLPIALLGVLKASRSGRLQSAGVAGASLAIACLTRAPTLILVPFAAFQFLLYRRYRAAGIFLAVACAVIALAPIRNYVVAGRPSLVATNAGATLLLAHTPTPKVRLARLDQHPLYNRLGIDRQTREVLEFIIQDPVGYAATLVPLAQYTLGFPGAVEADSPVAWELVILVVLYLAATIGFQRARGRDTWLSHVFIISHFLVMITFLPYVYGYRQVLPMYLIMLPICAVPIEQVARSIGHSVPSDGRWSTKAV